MSMWRSISLALLLIVPWATAQENRGPFHKIAIIRLKEKSGQAIDPSVKTSVLRRIEDAKEWGADCVIFDIESYGGYVTSSIETSQEILDLGRDIHTIAYVHRRAYSGAAMISLACREIIMSEAGTIGDSQSIYMGADGEMKVSPEKSQTTVAAEFRKFADRNGYPVALAEAMVRQEIEVFSYSRPVDLEDPGAGSKLVYFRADQLPDLLTVESERLTDQTVVVRAGELATFTAREAHLHGFASRLASDVTSVVEEISAGDAVVRTLDWSGVENASRWLLSIRTWLFLFGAVAAYIAFKTPGTGVPEAVAIILFGLFFGASAVAGFAEVWEIVLFFVGVALIVVEIFVLPGFGVAGFAGLLLVLASLALAAIPPLDGIDDYGGTSGRLVDLASDFMLGALGATVIMFFLARFLPSVPLFSRLSLAAPSAGAAMSSHAPTAPSPLVGATGESESDLRPAGRARIDGAEHDVVTEGGYVPAGRRVRVIEVRGPVIIVRPVEDESAASTP